MGALDGQVVSFNELFISGLDSLRFNIVLVSEGYREDELSTYHQDILHFKEKLFQFDAFNENKCAINLYSLDVISSESGADIPFQCDGVGYRADTYFDAQFSSNLCRLLVVDDYSVIDEVNSYLPNYDRIIVLVNSPRYGGSASRSHNLGVMSTSNTHWTGVTIDWADIAIHELVHTFGLGDEYMYLQGCGLDSSEQDHFPSDIGSEISPNLDITSDRQNIKWSDLVLESTPMPTMPNPDCGECNYVGSPVELETVGAFEGGGYHHCGIYRPQYYCLMGIGAIEGNSKLCAVCSREISNILSGYLDTEKTCKAPVFAKSNIIACILLWLSSPLIIAILILLAPFIGTCPLLQFLFRLRNCSRGNDNPCITL